jgi:hypothetical protein
LGLLFSFFKATMPVLRQKQCLCGISQFCGRNGRPDGEDRELSYKGKDFLLEKVDTNSVTKEAL